MKKEFIIDEITWNDLNMDEVYRRMNTAESSVGQEYLKKTLKTLQFDEQLLKNRNEKTNTLDADPKLTGALQKIFKSLGKTKKVSFLDHIFRIKELKPQSNVKHFILIILLLIAIALIFVNPAVGIIALVVMIALNIALYFRFRSEVEAYFNSLKYLVSMVITASKILKLNLPPIFAEDAENLKKTVHTFTPLKRGSWLITNSVSGSLVDVIMDYIRMIFHVDLIKFNSMKKCAIDNEDQILLLYNTLGELETCICIGAFRKDKPHCTPEFFSLKESDLTPSIQTENIWHPLTKKRVCNSINTDASVLLTGSNASGKSTFLKMIALNQIFAQTIYTCLADAYRTTFFKVISSMALTDNILGEESYFIVEIKSLKRIFNELEPDTPVLAFVDEVLRGTNTAERIAASSQILKKLSHENALVFAATHDIELTRILAEDMHNYHFSEHVEGDNVLFDYKLKEGSATSRNAILLLKGYGFDPEITEAAEKLADTYTYR